ncbi:MAG: CpaE family protein [Phenylobacterium sp.]|uniref:AAA family ATPase n=1 Tax=Phenylobacterium sp. TaxID=1871053 RepID=UPI00391A791C
MTHWSLLGRRVLAIGPALGPLARGPLFGAALEVAGVERLADVSSATVDLLLIDADAVEPQVLADAVAALGADSSPPTLVVGSRLPASVVRALMRIRTADVLESPFSDQDLQAAVYALLDRDGMEVPAPSQHASRCWSVVGAVGGSGATTIAIEIASALAARSGKDNSVCLVDLHLADGAAAAYLGAAPAMALAEFGPAAERMDAALLAAFTTPVGKGIDLLACPRDPVAFEQISREAVLRILEIACDTYDFVVVDMPRHRRPWTLEALAGSDEVLVVSELTVPALLAARALCGEIEAALPPARRARVVLNRLASRMFGPAPSTAEAERALERQADAGIASDWEAAAASVNLGGPVRQHRPKSKIVRDVAALVDRLLGVETQARRSAWSRKAA